MTDHEHSHHCGHPDRRRFLKDGIAASAAVLLMPPALAEALGSGARAVSDSHGTRSTRPYLDVARQAGAWLATSAKRDEHGVSWPADPAKPDSVQYSLYTGMPGVVLFHLELYHATREQSALDAGLAGADHLIQTLSREQQIRDWGLYTGHAGVVYTLEMAHRASGRERYRMAAKMALDLLKSAAKPAGDGVEWSPSTDIISGSAGIGLFLLWAGATFADAECKPLAQQAGFRLIERGQSDRGGTKWLISPQITRNYPNFSHGAAGVSYFLATLHQATGERAFLDAAKSGAAYLDALSTTTPGGGRMVFHSEPGNEHLYYLSWCHGPAGTARLYHRLGQVPGEGQYRERVAQLAQATLDLKVPERSPGFWNNISQCCGNTGVSEFFVDLHRLTGDRRHLTFAEVVSRDTITRGTAEGAGMKWIQAEHRVQPQLLIAQTGLMQGAAGVGLGMLHLDGALEQRAPFVVLPDNPY
jgi:lantibiotic modifying enzyme